jgi:hypothetical protein
MDPTTNRYIWADPSDSPFPERRQRKKLKPAPRQRAIEALAELQAHPIPHPATNEITKPPLPTDPFCGSYDDGCVDVTDMWDGNAMADFSGFDVPCPSSPVFGF